MVCEAIRADALVKHIIDWDCQDMGKFSYPLICPVGKLTTSD
jgi:hypothetical protein